MIVRTEAVVLQSIAFRETSRIVTLYTRANGKVTVIAKGARRPNSRFGSTLQPMSYTQVVFYTRQGRGIQTLTESSHVRLLSHIGRDMSKITAGLRIVELARALLQEEEQDPQAFDLLTEVLIRLNEVDGTEEHLVFWFQMQLAALLGFAPDFERADVAGLSASRGHLALDTGAVLSRGGGVPSVRAASRNALRAFAVFARAELDNALNWPLPPEVAAELRELIVDYVRYHVEGAYPDRSERVLRQMRLDS